MEHKHRMLPLIVIVALASMVAGFLIGSLHAQWPLRNSTVVRVAPSISEEVPLSRPHVKLQPTEESILHEMNAYAMRHVGVFDQDLRSFGTASDWSSGWQLYWVDVHHENGRMRIYHAVDVAHPQRRFTTMWSGGAAQWEQTY